MKNKELKKLKEGDIITNKNGTETYQYTGWNNGQIWDFLGIIYENEEEIEGHFEKTNQIRLTKNELKEFQKNF